MRSNLNSENAMIKIDEMRNSEVIFQVLEYEDLKGGKDVESAVMLSFMKDANIKLRQLRILLNDGVVKIEAGTLHFMKGSIEMDNKIGGLVGLGKKIFANKVTGEETFKPRYKGTGEMFLEPSFGHFALLELEDEQIIVDDGIFYACEDSVEVGAIMQKSLSSTLFGNEGLFQTQLSGSGIVALEVPVPPSEIIRCKLINDTLKVDGSFAILRSGRIDFTVEKSSKSLMATATGGEGLLNVFRGTGEVWLIPTASIYDRLKYAGLTSMVNPAGRSNNS
ncbi:AIM24 family protein [Desnuesiella massiliensis]|uniref:AIM24 family protein n=1 Tax=Desnuesiella massiliensis TaxID=1650662 RepID=UPI0006E448F8|nr:AIM24 family protein [Desnuesiella massiliensis]